MDAATTQGSSAQCLHSGTQVISHVTCNLLCLSLTGKLTYIHSQVCISLVIAPLFSLLLLKFCLSWSHTFCHLTQDQAHVSSLMKLGMALQGALQAVGRGKSFTARSYAYEPRAALHDLAHSCCSSGLGQSAGRRRMKDKWGITESNVTSWIQC